MCVLRVTGRHFDAEKYLALSGMTAVKVYHAGEPKSSTNPDGPRWQNSGFNVDVSHASWADLTNQTADAIAFLKAHEAALIMLRAAPGVDDVRLDFAVDLRIDRRKVMMQFEYFPPDLVSRAGAIGVGLELSIYPPDLEQHARSAR